MELLHYKVKAAVFGTLQLLVLVNAIRKSVAFMSKVACNRVNRPQS